MKNEIKTILAILMVMLLVTGCELELPEEKPPIKEPVTKDRPNFIEMQKFSSGKELVNAFEEGRSQGRGGFFGQMELATTADASSQKGASAPSEGRDYSDTNVQVEGVDEADIIKTDGDYIYTIAKGNLVIVDAYPAKYSEILSTTEIEDFRPSEIFLDGDRLLVFGSTYFSYEKMEPAEQGGVASEKMEFAPSYYPRQVGMMSAKLYDVSDREDPELLRTVEFEGNYLTSRKIGSDVYLVVNSYPRWYTDDYDCIDILPLYREATTENIDEIPPFPIAECTEIGYIEPIQANNFITIASIAMDDEDEEVEKLVIVGSGQNVYASEDNMYIAQTSWPRYGILGELAEDYFQKTIITKIGLYKGEVGYLGTGEAKGHILNQFSMDEWDGHFRIATTLGNVWDEEKKSSNNVYILDEDMDLVGSLEDLAPGERIYSVRFMGEKGYVVTFKKVDPLFVIDLSDHTDPDVLGKLKIPGYSDYLHPFDDKHIIGIGKDTVEAEENLKERRNTDFAWYQGIKMAIFDVSDVENPIEMHKVIIGDRGTNSEALHNHKAFLFDRERELLIIPITLAEIKGEKTSDNQRGDYTFQGAFVYDINLDDGFDLRGRVTHYDDDEVFKKSGYYFRGDSAIRRSLYIEDVLYTLSDNRLQLNDLDDLDRLNVLEFEDNKEEPGYPELMY